MREWVFYQLQGGWQPQHTSETIVLELLSNLTNPFATSEYMAYAQRYTKT
jgi:hypothetical protein